MLEQRSSHSAELSHKTTTDVPADQPLRMRGDWMAVEPLDANISSIIHVIHETKPVRGVVRAVGPGCYPKKYDHPDKHRRTKMWDSTRLLPTQVKVGDIVELGGRSHGGYAFQGFYWGDKYMIMCREADVCGIVVDESPKARSS